MLVLLLGSLTGLVLPAASARASPVSQMTIAVIGDYGCLAPTCVENATQQEVPVANLVHSWSPDLIFTVGDNSYNQGTTAEIQADQQPYSADVSAGRLYQVAGVHDWGQQCTDPTYIQKSSAYFGRPAHYVAHLGSGLLDFFATDMNCADPDGDVAGSAQAKQYLADVSASTAVWKIAGAHSPLYSSGVDFGSQPFTHWAITPQIDLFMSGHDHDMEHLVEGGQHFIVDGTSGEETRPLTSPPVSGSVWGDGNHFGAVRLTVTQYTLKVDFVSLGNVVLHSFTLNKGTPPGNGTVTGTVTNAGTGLPVQGATVSYSGGIATSDPAGTYRLANVPPGTYSVSVTASGYVPASQVVVVGSGANTMRDFALSYPPPLKLSGQVTDSLTGKPISGAGVSYSGGSTTSDANGNYGFASVSAGSYPFGVSASGYQSQTRSVTVGPAFVQRALANAGSGGGWGATTVSASLSNPVGANDRVVVGVRVDSNPNGAVVQSVTDSAGNVYTKHVTATNNRPSGYQAEVTIWSAVATAASTSTLTVTAAATASADLSIGAAEYSGLSTVSGAGAIDQTAAGGAVATSGPASGPTAATTNNNELAVGVYGDGGSNVAISPAAGWSQRFNNSANTQGTIALEDQVVKLASSAPNSQWSNSSPNSWAVAEAVFKSASTSTQNFALSLPPVITPLSLNGQLTDSRTGKPVSGAAVSYGSGTSSTSDAGGNYSFTNVSAGAYQLTVNASGYQSQARSVTVGPAYVQGALATAGTGGGSGATAVSASPPNPVGANDRVVVGVRVDSNPNGAVVQSVTDSAGNVYTKHVTATNNRPSGFQAEVTVWSTVVTTASTSRLTVTATATGSADLSIGLAEYSGLSTESGAGAVDQTAAGGAVATSGPASGPTQATTNSNELAVGVYGDGGSNVAISPAAGWSQRFNNSANNQGTIALEDQLVANAGGTPNSQWSNASPNSWAVAEAVFKAAPASIQNFALNAVPNLTGTVKTAAGQPLAGAGVAYQSGNAPVSYMGPPVSGSSTISDSSGNYSFSIASPGTYTLTASATGFASQVQVITIVSGGATVQNFSLNPLPAYVQGALANAGTGGGSGATAVSASPPNPVGANDRVVVGVRVDSNPNGAVVQSVTDSAGNVYTKHVTATNNRPSGFQAEVTVWSTVVTTASTSRLTVTATATGSADLSIGVAEYSGLSTVSGAGAVDQTAAGGAVATSGPASGPTQATTNSNELAVGLYGDGGSNVAISPAAGWSQRFNNSANDQGTIALEDQLVASAGGTPNSQWSNASPNSWAVAEAVFKAR